MFLDMTLAQFLDAFFKIGRTLGYPVEMSRNGRQIDYGHKKLSERHLRKLHPEILQPDAHIPSLINRVAPGRPCAHRPTREIIEAMARG